MSSSEVSALPVWRLREIGIYAVMVSRRYARRSALFLESLDEVFEESQLMAGP